MVGLGMKSIPKTRHRSFCLFLWQYDFSEIKPTLWKISDNAHLAFYRHAADTVMFLASVVSKDKVSVMGRPLGHPKSSSDKQLPMGLSYAPSFLLKSLEPEPFLAPLSQ